MAGSPLTPDEMAQLARVVDAPAFRTYAPPTPDATPSGPVPPMSGDPMGNTHMLAPGQLNPGQARTANETIQYSGPPPQVAPPPRPAYAPVTSTTIPGHWDPTSRSTETQEGMRLSPEAQGAQQQAAQQAVVANVAQTNAEREQAQVKARALADAAAVHNAENIADVEAQHRRSVAEDAELVRVRQAQADAAKEIDPNHYWSEKGTIGKIAASIGLALGGFASALTGGPNQVAEQVNRDIDRDIDAQRQKILSGQQAVDRAQGVYGLMRQKGLDDAQATVASRIAGAQQKQEEINAQLAQTDDKLVQARGQAMLADTAKYIADQQTKLDQLTSSRVVHRGAESYTPEKTVYSGGAPIDKHAGERAAMMRDAILKGADPAAAQRAANMTYPPPEGYSGGASALRFGGAGQGATAERQDAALRDLEAARQRVINARGVRSFFGASPEYDQAVSDYQQAMMNAQQIVHGISATRAHVAVQEHGIPSPRRPGGSAALEREQGLTEAERREIQRRSESGEDTSAPATSAPAGFEEEEP